MRTIILVIILSGILFCQNKNNNIDQLLKKWDSRDGAEVFTLTFNLSKSLLLNDTAFFSSMRQNENKYDEWLSKLQSFVFTIYDYDDKIDIILHTAYYDKLKELMQEKAAKFKSDKVFGRFAEKLLKKLDCIKVEKIE